LLSQHKEAQALIWAPLCLFSWTFIACVHSFCMSFAPIIALLPFHFALIFTSFYLWSTFLLVLLINSFQFCISFFWIYILFYFFSTQLFIPFNFAFIISTLFSMRHFFSLFELQVLGLIYAFTFLVFILSTSLYPIVLLHVVPHTPGLLCCASSDFGY